MPSFVSFPHVRRLGVALGAALTVAVALAGCGSPQAVPADKFYRLDPLAQTKGEVALKGIVEIDRFAAAGSLANRSLLFSEPGSGAVTEYHYHFWIEAPPSLVQGALVSYLRSANVIERVVTPEMRIRPDYTITGRILRMETVRASKTVGAVTFELSLRRESDGQLLVLGEYRAEVPVANHDVDTEVKAIQAAVDEAFARFVTDIRASVK